MSNTPKRITLSVITPVLNAADTIKQTLNSLEALPGDQIEHIIVDGGSTDGTRALLDTYADIIVIDQTGSGISEALNLGIEAASGMYIVALNADDYFLPAIQQVIAHLARHDNKVFYTDICQHDPLTRRTMTRSANLENMPKFMSLYHPGLFVPRLIYQQLGGYLPDYKLAMDSEWVHRCMAAGVAFQHLPICTSFMRLRGKSHLNTFAAKREFERSVINHGLAHPVAARWYRIRQTLFHLLFKNDWFQQLWLTLRR